MLSQHLEVWVTIRGAATQGREGESRERGIESAGGEFLAARAKRAKKAFCRVLLLYFFVNISTIKT